MQHGLHARPGEIRCGVDMGNEADRLLVFHARARWEISVDIAAPVLIDLLQPDSSHLLREERTEPELSGRTGRPLRVLAALRIDRRVFQKPFISSHILLRSFENFSRHKQAAFLGAAAQFLEPALARAAQRDDVPLLDAPVAFQALRVIKAHVPRGDLPRGLGA